MGVKGLQTFLKENRQSLCSSIHLDRNGAAERGQVAVVVDAWGVIFQLYLDCLPWTSGGEYLRFYQLVSRLVESWRSVGLEPTFVFDGTAPPDKHTTLLDRFQRNLTTSRLFFTTSPASRSSPSFSHSSAILPPFASHTFFYALASLDVAIHIVPYGEADAKCVALADTLGGYVLGKDSDFVILIGATSGRMGGYCPLDMMMWIEGEEDVSSPESTPGGFTTVSRRSPSSVKTSTLLPPAHLSNPTLVLVCFAPDALRKRLRISAGSLPLFASLIGTDYTPPEAVYYFFDAGETAVRKVEKVARVLREHTFQPKKTGVDPGDQAVDLVKRVVKKLATRDFLNEQTFNDLVDSMINSMFQYILPNTTDCCDLYPFCGGIDGVCSTETSIPPITLTEIDKARRAYARARKSGLIPTLASGYLHPDRVYLWSILEDPQTPSHRASPGSRAIRQKAWEITEMGLGELRWPPMFGEELASWKEDLAARALLDVDGDHADAQGDDGEPAIPTSSRTIIEWSRQGSSNKISSARLALSPLPDTTPPCLLPLSAKLKLYTEPLHSDTTAIRSLPTAYHPLVSALRFCVLEAALRTHQDMWRRTELEAVLMSCIGTFTQWKLELDRKDKKANDTALTFPLLTNRNCDLVSQLTSTLTDSQLLAQSLLLTVHGTGDELVTHMIPFVFFSGMTLHTVLAGKDPSVVGGWKWGSEQESIYGRCLAAIVEGIEGKVVGWAK
ncbi:hypothetical protein P7C73_g5432, partial [Tremellales sp. Uapishka_1]